MFEEDLERLLRGLTEPKTTATVDVLRGGPGTWDEFIGQDRAKARLRAAVARSKAEGGRFPHTLIKVGQAGAGKTALSRLLAHQLGVGVLDIGGKITADEALEALSGVEDGTVVLIDEVHQLGRATWILTVMEDGWIQTASGPQHVPDVTIVAATTDAGRLTEALRSRFTITVQLDPYSLAEATQVARSLAEREGVTLNPGDDEKVARAAAGVPRAMRSIIATYADTAYSGDGPSFDLALTWAGLTYDGLDELAQNYLLRLLIAGGRAGQATLAAQLGEPGPIGHTEQRLLQAGFITIEPGGRQLTATGTARARELAEERING